MCIPCQSATAIANSGDGTAPGMRCVRRRHFLAKSHPAWHNPCMLAIAVGIVFCLAVMGWAQLANESRPGWWQKTDSWTQTIVTLIESDDRWTIDAYHVGSQPYENIRHPNGAFGKKLLELAPNAKSRHLLNRAIAAKIAAIRQLEAQRQRAEALAKFVDG